jgi:hypothetical protein
MVEFLLWLADLPLLLISGPHDDTKVILEIMARMVVVGAVTGALLIAWAVLSDKLDRWRAKKRG